MAKKVLVVDDDPTILRMASWMLQVRGFEISTAMDGEEALVKAAEVPDLILLDIRLPVLDGFEVLRRLKKDKRTEMIPVVYSTADVSIDFEKLSPDLAADGILVKPYTIDQLHEKLQRLIK